MSSPVHFVIWLIHRTLVAVVPDLQESGFARKWTEMDRNRYIIGYGMWSVIEQPTNHVKTSLTMDLWSVTNAQNVGINENETIHAKATW